MALDAGQIFERYSGTVYRRCLALLRNEDEAAEAVQEVFTAAVAGLGRFRLRAAPLTWLYAIATRHCLKQLRDRSAHALKHALFVGDGAHEPDFSGVADLERALKSLSVEELELLLHAWRDGLTQEEIAEVTRRSRKTVGKQLKRLSERLNLALEPAVPAAVLAAQPESAR